MVAAGTPAPDFTLPDLEGRAHSLAEARARGPVLVVFWQAGCGTCKVAAPYLNRLHASYPETGWTFWTVAQDADGPAREFAASFALRPTVLVDGPEMAASDAYDPDATPAFYLVEPDGRVSAAFDGFNKEWLNEISRRVAERTAAPYIEVAPADDGVAPFRPG